MANYTVIGKNISIFASNDAKGLAGRLLYVNSKQFGILNADGTKTYVNGVNLVWNAATGKFLTDAASGKTSRITSIDHFDRNGLLLDSLETGRGGSLGTASYLQSLLESTAFSASVLFSGNDTISAAFRLNNRVIDDTLAGYNGNDTISGGTGNDRLIGDRGDDKVFGGAGNDVVMGDRSSYYTGNDQLNGGNGNDLLWGSGGNDAMFGGSGTDTAIYSGLSANLRIVKTATGFTVSGADGTDTLRNIERIATDDGTFEFSSVTNSWKKVGNAGGFSLAEKNVATRGTAGDDLINLGTNGDDYAGYGLGGNDTITFTGKGKVCVAFGGNGNDTIDASAATGGQLAFKARLYGDNGNDSITGTNLADVIGGGSGDDTLNGGSGRDFLSGGAGADRINGGGQNDVMRGGDSADIFVFESVDDTGWGNDTILDFKLGIDKLEFGGSLSEATLTDTSSGLLVSFVLGNGAETGVTLRGISGVTDIADLLLLT
jgi:Ca2+-binding RTX toxin-like protein